MTTKLRKKIFVIEDDIDNVDLYLYMLEKKYVVSASYTGREGLKKVYKEKPDLIVLDLVLPDISGYEIARDVKSNEKLKSIPIIAISAHNMYCEKERALNSGCDEYIVKPFRQLEFMAHERVLLRKGRLKEGKVS